MWLCERHKDNEGSCVDVGSEDEVPHFVTKSLKFPVPNIVSSNDRKLESQRLSHVDHTLSLKLK